MKNHTLVLAALLLIIGFPQSARSWGDKGPTAIVQDAETGKPVEGAIALAQYFGAVSLGAGLGTSQGLAKTEEVYSDKDGHINLPDFWKWQGNFLVGNPKPRLAVYKFGYVLWDSQDICPFGSRTDFDENHRTVKLLKFETEAARWIKENYYEGKVGPRGMHCGFLSLCDPHSQKFREIFRANELPLKDKEEDEYSQKLKKEFKERQKLK